MCSIYLDDLCAVRLLISVTYDTPPLAGKKKTVTVSHLGTISRSGVDPVATVIRGEEL